MLMPTTIIVTAHTTHNIKILRMVHHIQTQNIQLTKQQTRIQAQKTQNKTQQKICKRNLHNIKKIQQ